MEKKRKTYDLLAFCKTCDSIFYFRKSDKEDQACICPYCGNSLTPIERVDKDDDNEDSYF